MTTNNRQNGTSGFSMDRAPLRALAHAQGQLIHSHKDLLLFFAIDTLVHIAQAPQTQALESIRPTAFETARTYGIYLVDPDARKALFDWDVNAATKDCRKALHELSVACLETGSNPEDCAARERLARLAAATVNYLDMAADIRDPDLTGTFQRASKINPHTSAAFIAAYMQRIGDDLRQRASKDNACGGLANGFTEARNDLEKMLPQNITPLHTFGEDKIDNVYNLMDMLSAIADLARDTNKATLREKSSDPRLAQALHYTFITAAVYDWKQFDRQDPANDTETTPMTNNVLQFTIR